MQAFKSTQSPYRAYLLVGCVAALLVPEALRAANEADAIDRVFERSSMPLSARLSVQHQHDQTTPEEPWKLEIREVCQHLASTNAQLEQRCVQQKLQRFLPQLKACQQLFPKASQELENCKNDRLRQLHDENTQIAAEAWPVQSLTVVSPSTVQVSWSATEQQLLRIFGTAYQQPEDQPHLSAILSCLQRSLLGKKLLVAFPMHETDATTAQFTVDGIDVNAALLVSGCLRFDTTCTGAACLKLQQSAQKAQQLKRGLYRPN